MATQAKHQIPERASQPPPSVTPGRWNAPLPKGGFAVANDVKLTIELDRSRRMQSPAPLARRMPPC